MEPLALACAGLTWQKPRLVGARYNSTHSAPPAAFDDLALPDTLSVATAPLAAPAGKAAAAAPAHRIYTAYSSAVSVVPSGLPSVACPQAMPDAANALSSLCFAQQPASLQVLVAWSDDGGATWAKPVPVAAAPPAAGLKRFFPALAIGAGPYPTVSVVYYEAEEVDVAATGGCTMTLAGPGSDIFRVGNATSAVSSFVATSLDGGRTFLPPRRISQVRKHSADGGGGGVVVMVV